MSIRQCRLRAFLICLFAIVSISAQAFEIDKIKSDDSIEKIAKRNLYRVQKKYGDDLLEYSKEIKKWNPQITNWIHPPKNQLIYVDYPYNAYLSGSTWTPQLPIEDVSTEFNRSFSLSAFYANSFGSYTEKTNNQNVSSGQNFPITLGLGMSSGDDEKKHFLVSSLYWAQSSKGSITNSDSTTSTMAIPAEIGGNLYYQYFFPQSQFGLYSGYDFEKLNTFNTQEILIGSKLKNISNQIHYGTLGFVKGFSLWDFKMNVKASISKTVSSQSSLETPLSGIKYILYYTYKPEGIFSLNAFYKHHSLSGNTKLAVDRYGFSLGILVF